MESTPPARSVAPPKGLVARRRRPALIIASVLLIVVSATGGAALFAAKDNREEVLAVARPIAYGQKISAADLRVVRWTETTGIKTVPASAKDSLVGKSATTNLRPDTLLSPEQFADRPAIQPGQVTVGVALTGEQLPVRPLTPGQKILLVSTPGKNADQVKDLPAPIEGTVVEVGTRDERSGKTVVEVAVAPQDGPALAQRSYTERIAVVARQSEAGR